MKTFKPLLFALAGLLLTMTSCRTENDLSIDPPTDTVLDANSTLAHQIQRVTMNDGSVDNIVYNANCFTIQLPITVTINGVELTITDVDDYDDLEDILDEFDDDDDEVHIDFPITIILSDYTEIEVNSLDQLDDLADDCNDENEIDDDIECLDFVYPITVSVYNTNNEVIAAYTFTNDHDFYDFIYDIDEDDLIGFEFPLSIVLSDGVVIDLTNLTELENAIDDYEDDCDEDDDYDYGDDDCNDCTPSQLETVLTACSDWYIEEFERNDNDLEDNYEGYVFEFFTNNTLNITWAGNTENGTWTISGTGNNITVTFDIPGFDDLNETWNLKEIDTDDDDIEVSFEIGDDELEFKNDYCN